MEAGWRSRHSDWLRGGWPTVRSSSASRGKICFLSTSPSPVLGPTQPPLQRVLGVFSSRVKRPGREADNSSQTIAGIKNTWIYTSTPPYTFLAYCIIVKHKDNFTLTKMIISFASASSLLISWQHTARLISIVSLPIRNLCRLALTHTEYKSENLERDNLECSRQKLWAFKEPEGSLPSSRTPLLNPARVTSILYTECVQPKYLRSILSYPPTCHAASYTEHSIHCT
jgi:hypothetical protein